MAKHKAKHKATLYWAERAMFPEWGYEPVDAHGRVYGYVECLPEVREKVCAKRRADYIEKSMADCECLPIWC